MISAQFRFDKATHAYFIGEKRVWSITQLLDLGGHTDDRWFTEEDAERGTIVHQLCADFDFGAIDETYEGIHAGYLQAYIAISKVVSFKWRHVETGAAHAEHRFAGTPDRVGEVLGALAVADLKSGSVAPWQGIQTALQAILVASELHLPPDRIRRYVIRLRPNGRYTLIEHKDHREFHEAYRLIDKFCRA